MIQYITNLLKSSVTFIVGLVFGIIIGVVGLVEVLNVEVFGVPLLFPFVFLFVFVGFFVILYFKDDKIEQIKEQ